MACYYYFYYDYFDFWILGFCVAPMLAIYFMCICILFVAFFFLSVFLYLWFCVRNSGEDLYIFAVLFIWRIKWLISDLNLKSITINGVWKGWNSNAELIDNRFYAAQVDASATKISVARIRIEKIWNNCSHINCMINCHSKHCWQRRLWCKYPELNRTIENIRQTNGNSNFSKWKSRIKKKNVRRY